MSRIAKYPIHVPTGVEVTVNGQEINAKGKQGQMRYTVHPTVKPVLKDNIISFKYSDKVMGASMQAGTSRANVNNIVKGVNEGFERKLKLVGVGYRAQVQGNSLNLTLGYSHPIVFKLPEGIKAETPAADQIVIKGIDKVLVGQVASDIRNKRPPEPYKGKGVRYDDEIVRIKETKKK